MGSYRYEILRETTTDSLIMENNTREKKILNEKNTIATYMELILEPAI